jgi:hypothetical protein
MATIGIYDLKRENYSKTGMVILPVQIHCRFMATHFTFNIQKVSVECWK